MTSFGELARQYRRAAALTQEQLAARTGLSVHAISDLEREIALAPHAQTVQLLADALGLSGTALDGFRAAALRHRISDRPGTAAPGGARATTAARRGDPQAWLSAVVAELDDGGIVAARHLIGQWGKSGRADRAAVAWAEELVELAAAGRLRSSSQRPIPAPAHVTLQGREPQIAELTAFLDRVERGRGGLALVLGPAGIGKSSLLSHVLAERRGGIDLEWMTFDRGESGYQGWRRLLGPSWTTLRRTELAPASLLAYRTTLDNVLLAGSDGELADRHFSGEIAAAVAALLAHMSLRQPVTLVIDDAHRGGPSSDQLLIDVARRLNPHSVALIAALRPDELDIHSPLRGYDAEGDGRAAVDVVTPILVPPLDMPATAALLRERLGTEPPPRVVEDVRRQTAGRPQLIQNIEIQASPQDGERPARQASAWAVGKLAAAGLRVLDSTIQSRPETARRILQVAAISAGDRQIDPEVIARLTGLDTFVVEETLDDERRRGTILAPQIPGYRFEHDNWIDTLIGNCPAVQQRAIHAQCLALLRADPAADPRVLAQHAIAAGPALAEPGHIVTWASQAADLNMTNYAFGAAADLYREAATHASGQDRINLLVKQAGACRPDGRWDEAREALKLAASLARRLDLPGREAMALMHLERLTWSYGFRELDMTRQLRDVIGRIPAGETILRAQVQAALATRLCSAPRQHENEQSDLASALLGQLPAVGGTPARGDILIGIRNSLQDHATTRVLLGYDQQILDLGIELRSPYHIHEGLCTRIVDLIREGRLHELPAAMRALRDFADQLAAPTAWYLLATIEAMLALARGHFDLARAQTDLAAESAADWGDSTAGEAIIAQVGWRLYETGEIDGLTELLTDLPARDVASPNEIVWQLGVGLIHAERNEPGPAAQILRDICDSTGNLANLPRGPARSAILATAATLLGHPALSDTMPQDTAARYGHSLTRLLTEHPDNYVIAGWPAVILGSKNRHIGLASAAAGQLEQASTHLADAAEENAEFPVLQARTHFDLARTLLRQPGRHADGNAILDRAMQQAEDLQMPRLAAQAIAERIQQS